MSLTIFLAEDVAETAESLIKDPYEKIRRSFLRGALARWVARARASILKLSSLT